MPNSHEINLQTASQLTSNYRRESGQNPILGGSFPSNVFTDLLNQSGCTGIRYYYGIDDKGVKQLVLVGIDEYGNDMLSLIMDVSNLCPDTCSTPNALNS